MLNGDLETDFLVNEGSEATLRIQHDGLPNRTKITAQDIGSTSFAAQLRHVQYGTFDGEDAVLLQFIFKFRFEPDSIKRFKAAVVSLKLEETQDAKLTDPVPRNPRNDPKVLMIAPVQVCGELKTETKSRRWQLSIPVQYEAFGFTAGPEIHFGAGATAEVDRRMWITGYTTSDDDHYEDNIAIWDTKENEVQESGILRSFPATLVTSLPKEPKHPIKLSGIVQPSIAFSLNPVRLISKKDDPVFLDRTTPKGSPVGAGMDFNSKDFPWDEFLKIPQEYSDISN